MAESGQQALDDQSPAADRIAEIRDYFAFIAAEIEGLNERWRQRERSGRSSGT
ncbi:hypothetical protein [Microlunatus soli]|uniref:hypothetical protein n=1 Tax=Microlunatus soli TaxID=630515 RepID=UPI0012F8DE28|nr:hypothetical protein [Microlunatus soli]